LSAPSCVTLGQFHFTDDMAAVWWVVRVRLIPENLENALNNVM
jgi:hypothetical protein